MMRTSAHAREVQLAAPAREQRLAEPTVDRLAKLGVLGNDRLSLQPRLLAEPPAREQDAVRLPRAAADAAAQLVQLREPEALGVLDQHDGGVRDVDADLDDGGGHE